MTRNQIIIAIVSVIALFGFITGAYFLTNKPQKLIFPEVNKILPTDHVKWATDSAKTKNILVEYSDLQCPACKSFHDIIKNQIESDKNITGKVTFVYRHFPLTNIHKNAEKAAYGAEAAGKQGKFFEFANLLFKTQEGWSETSNPEKHLANLATEITLDVNKFEKDVKSNVVKEKVNKDIASGNRAEVNATPTFYLNGEKLDSIRSFDEFKKLLQEL